MARIVIALGGNALNRADESGSWADARRHAREALSSLPALLRQGEEIVLTHGNGPQVGNLLLQQESTREVPPLPLDAVGAATEGWIGYLLAQVLSSELARRRIEREVVVLATRTVVSSKDPAFRNPTKPVGRFYDENESRLLVKQRGWNMVHDVARGGWRRVVPSPRPEGIVEGRLLRELLDHDGGRRVVPIVAGGGGVPVVRRAGGAWEGVEAVIDKDRTASLLARELGASVLAVLTDVPQVYVGFRTARERALGEVGVPELERELEAGEFGEGSMRPKVEAALDFVRGGGSRAIITDPAHLPRALEGRAGTQIVRDERPRRR